MPISSPRKPGVMHPRATHVVPPPGIVASAYRSGDDSPDRFFIQMFAACYIGARPLGRTTKDKSP